MVTAAAVGDVTGCGGWRVAARKRSGLHWGCYVAFPLLLSVAWRPEPSHPTGPKHQQGTERQDSNYIPKDWVLFLFQILFLVRLLPPCVPRYGVRHWKVTWHFRASYFG